ncbi:transporter substrate-binding domain-containing protein [bacterium]|nr:transporter substrate-binding domain-containing protein [bacterium]
MKICNMFLRDSRMIWGLLVVFFVVLINPLYGQSRRVRLGVYENAPKVFKDEQGKFDGLFVELIKEIAAEEEWELVYHFGSWSECLEGLVSGEIDLMLDVAYSEERDQIYSFNEIPTIYSWFEVYRHPRVEISTFFDLDGKKVAVLDRSIQHRVFESNITGFGIQCEIITTKSFDEAFQLVSSGVAEAVVTNRFFGERHKEAYNIKGTGIVFYPTGLHYVTAKGQNLELLEAIDHHLGRWKKDKNSVYYQSLRRWMGEEPPTALPRHLKVIFGAIGALLLMAFSLSYLLKWQVNVRTEELRDKNYKLDQALNELRQAQEQAIHQERFHVLGQMASGIAHDFNNILTLILGYSELLLLKLGDSEDDERYRKDLQMIGEVAMDGAQLVMRMKEFYRTTKEDHQSEPISINEQMLNILELAQPYLSTKTKVSGIDIKLKKDFQGEAIIVGNRAELREAFLNLVFNAIDSMPYGGQLTISTRTDGDMIWVSVSDTGTGMSEEVKKNCMKPFYTTKGSKGTGMGLTMVSAIAERHGGRIEIQSEEGQGTTFTLIFPVQPPGDQQIGQDKALPQYVIKPLDILVVDDDPRFLDALVPLLEVDGHTVHTALRPSEAIGKLRNSQFDIMLVDLAMPEMSGIQLIDILRSRGYEIPMIVVTGTLEKLSELASSTKNVTSVLRKPISMQRLREVFANLGFEDK